MKSNFLAFLLCLSQFCVIAQLSTVQIEVQNVDFVEVLVTKVYDGDGCRAIFPDGSTRKLRFANIDAPEIKNAYVNIDTTQPFAVAARDTLRNLIAGKSIWIDTMPFGSRQVSYDRLLVDAYFLNSGDTTLYFLQSYLVCVGAAWYVPTTKKLARTNSNLETEIEDCFELAKTKKIGLWKKRRAVTPAYWRKNVRKKVKKVV